MAPLLVVSVLATLAPALATAPAAAASTTAPDATAPGAAPGAPAANTTAPGTTTAGAAPDSTAARQLVWRDCPTEGAPELRCATLKVPLDYRNPGGRKIDIEISRLRAADPGQRRGILAFNPGGPGGPGLDLPGRIRPLLPAGVVNAYDLIGFDPRGVGKSTPLRCGLAPEEIAVERPYNKATFARDTALSRSFAEKCRAKYGDGLKHFNTRNTARDMDAIRAALGERKLNYFGISYGTYLGAVYTQLFPERSGRIVLDSGVDPARVWQEDFRLWATEAEKAFDRWAEWAAARNERYGLGATPKAVSRTFWKIVAQADRKPIKLGDRLYDGATIRAGMRPAFFTGSLASEWAVHLKEAAAGKPVPALPVYDFDENFVVSMWAVTCGDENWPRDPKAYARQAARDKARYPLYGDYVSHITPCAFWDDIAEPTTAVDNKVGALILHNEWDSQTPLPDGIGLREAMKGARLALVEGGEGHGVYPARASSCAIALADTYLVTGKLPARDVRCATDPVPAGQQKQRAEVPFLTPGAR
ncbi:alpha/beta fold hydrolase [Streptomyces qinzhouensis]|uniref:Alpha/beta hydrolase n=1 Tax=Streptomyces qinzhouensis TaxID=2599401 RepID=A0A5B8JM96_9ACTN|nr:alpha/beta hydrolase [Streptomyces qinzhouensis]